MGTADGMFTGDLQRRLAEVERQLRNLTSGRRLEDASIGARGIRLLDGGELTVFGGAIRMTDATGSVGLLYFGPNSAGQPSWFFSFDDGELAGGLFGSPGSTYWSWGDRQGNGILSSDGLTGVGLAEPSLNIYMVPSAGTSVGTGGPFWPEFVNSSFQEVMHSITKLWHPRISIGVDTSTASGTVEWQLRIDGVTAGSGVDNESHDFEIPGWGDTVKPGAQRSVQLWARNTLGTASRLIVDRCYGTKS
jgi:hypothetical protein